MRKVLVAVIFFALVVGFSLSLSESQKTVKDGNWWSGMVYAAKVDYIGGFWNGVTWSDAVIKDAMSDFKKKGRLSDELYNDIFNKWLDYTDIGTTSVGDIVTRLDSFYDNPLNSKIKVEGAMDIVVFNIQGLTMSDPTIQNLLKTLRDNAR